MYHKGHGDRARNNNELHEPLAGFAPGMTWVGEQPDLSDQEKGQSGAENGMVDVERVGTIVGT